jgi:hypothetical protein
MLKINIHLFSSQHIMINRITYSVILLLSAILMLAHDIVPHHAHEDGICFHMSSCHDDHSHPSRPDHTNHPTEDTSNCCALSCLIIITTSNQNHIIQSACCNNEHKFRENPGTGFVGIIIHDKNCHSLICLSFRQHPPATSYYTSFSNHFNGLRAPPEI